MAMLFTALGLSVDGAGQDGNRDDYVRCHIVGNPNHYSCDDVSDAAPEKLPDDEGQYIVTACALQITDHHKEGFNLSNFMALNPTLDFTLSAD